MDKRTKKADLIQIIQNIKINQFAADEYLENCVQMLSSSAG